MSARVRKSKTAEREIESIADWISRDSVEAAERWLDGLTEQFERIADAPGMGTDQSHLRPRMRSTPFKNYLIFFRPRKGGIDIVRVIHGARDYRQLFTR